jgi:hypothetical protein
MSAQDPRPGSWQESQIRRDVIESGRRQRARWAQLDQQFADSQARVDDLLSRELAAAKAAADLAAAEPVPDPVAAPYAGETPVDLVPPPAEDITPAQFAQWRAEHIRTDRGIIT